ncbi:ATP-binding protein [Sorangium sp. So ce1024]|uniref:ATP-binding protein n=1 Tax=Sorangium sp. So ce1024 TaxID=3133327 RepID=UPI003F052411
MDDDGPFVETSITARLRGCKGDVLARWTRRVRDDPEAERPAEPVLVRKVPDLFDDLVEVLSASRRAEQRGGEDAELVGASARVEEHARLCAAQGHCIAAALRELSHLRAALLEVCVEQGISLGVREAQVLHAALDATMWTTAVEIEAATRAALEDGAARLRLATRAGGVGVWDYDLVTGKLRWDERTREVAGLDRELEVRYDLFLASIHPDDRARVEEAVRRSQTPESGGEYSVEYRVVGLCDRVERWIAVQGRTFFDAAGRGVRMLGTVIDVTDRKQAEAARREELLLRDRFMAAFSHYLNTPLTSITLAASVLAHHGNLTPRQARNVERIATSARRMARTINDLLDMNRSRFGGSVPIAPKPEDLHALCKSAVDELRVAHRDVPIQLDVQGSGAGLWDPERIAQMVTNLVQNAIDHADPGSAVGVTVRPRGSGERGGGGERGSGDRGGGDDELLIEVHNDGPAIAPELLETLFDPFHRAAVRGRRSTGRGLGLGLFIAQQIARAHGGAIEVESKAARGTTFTARLPRRAGAAGS